MPETKAPIGSMVISQVGATKWRDNSTKKADASSTANRLLHYAFWHVASQGYEFDNQVTQEIVTLTQDTSSTIHGGTTPSELELSDFNLAVELKTRIAEAEIGMLIDLMISDSPATQLAHLTMIQESAFSSAKLRLCPIWLIC